MLEARILHILTGYFENLENPTPVQKQYAERNGKTIPFDKIATLSGRRFYIVVKQNTNINFSEGEQILREVSELVNLRIIEQLPLLVAAFDGNSFQIGFLLFWDYNRYYLNNDIHWRELNVQTNEWLKLQLQAHRQRIVQLPLKNLRVKKTIYLNTKDYLESEVIYLRKFDNNYRMSTPPILTEQERFNRMLSGTPENEYPQDDLDKLILHTVLMQYPEAEVKSKLLLFDVDLLDIRHLKDKRKNRFSIHGVSTFYDRTGQVLGGGQDNFTINLEIYYYPNFFKAFGISPIDKPIMIDSRKISYFKQLLTTYEPISEINI